MSFNTITIERRQPILDKRFVKIPGAENHELPPITYEEAVAGLNPPTGDKRVGLLNFGVGKNRNLLPYYQKNMNLDFLTYETVNTKGYPVNVGAGPVDDIQQSIRDIASSKY
jgi:hypothetical protein